MMKRRDDWIFAGWEGADASFHQIVTNAGVAEH